MTLFQIVAGILGVALVTAVLYIWGLRKAMGGEEDLNRRLLSACGSRVVKRLKKQPSITEAEAAHDMLYRSKSAGKIVLTVQ